jgi:hypothetical protein
MRAMRQGAMEDSRRGGHGKQASSPVQSYDKRGRLSAVTGQRPVFP